MKFRMPSVIVLILLFAVPFTANAYEIPFSQSAFMEIRADLTYTAKVRTEDPDPDLVQESYGNSNFEKGDLMNNKGIAKMELYLDMPYLVLFGKGEAFYDRVMDDDDMYHEDADIDEAKRYAAKGYEAQEYYLDFHTDRLTLRLGRQVVEWGELIAPVFAPGVGVINIMDGSRIGAAGYKPRDYKVPGLMGWLNIEVTNFLAVEGVYAPDFDPRYAIPVVGTSLSFIDIGGFGAPDTFSAPGSPIKMPYEDRRPTEFEDMQQYGGCVRKVFPSLNSLEMGLYYFHYIDWSPMVDFEEGVIFATYEEMDMYGTSFSYVITSLGLDLQISGELAYRPNEPAPVAALTAIGELPAGFVETRTLNWGLAGSRSFSDILSFTPWVVQFNPMFEVYGGNNLDYDDEDKLEGNVYLEPERVSYYMAMLNFDSADMVDNTRLRLTFSLNGALHKEQNSLHGLTTTLTANIGDSFEVLFGYEYKIGDPEEASLSPHNMPDRDSFTCSLTLYFI